MDAYLLALDRGQAGAYKRGPLRVSARFGKHWNKLIAYAHSHSRVKSLPAGPTIQLLLLLDKLGLSPLAPWHYLTYHKTLLF